MLRGLIGTALASAMLMVATKPACSQETSAPPGAASTADTATSQAPMPPARAALVPEAFTVPTLVNGPGFKLVPLGPDLVRIDYDAYMSSIEHLQKTFSRSTGWPHAGISSADAMTDMQSEAARFASRSSFAYAVLTPDGRRERGSVYVSRSPVAGYDAMVRMWVTKDEFDRGFDAQLYRWVVEWVRKDWPFAKVAYPGRAIDWKTWDAAVAANKPDHRQK